LVLQKRHERSIRRNWIVCIPLHRTKDSDQEFLVDITIGACEAFDHKGQNTRTVFGKRSRQADVWWMPSMHRLQVKLDLLFVRELSQRELLERG